MKKNEDKIDTVVEKLLDKMIERGMEYPGVRYYPTADDHKVLEMEFFPPGQVTSDGSPRRLSYQHKYCVSDDIGTEDMCIAIVGEVLIETLDGQRQVKH